MKNEKNTIKKEASNINNDDLAFGKSNFQVMIAGVVLIAIGFIIMSLDKEEFGFGFMGLTLGPIVVFIGFMVEFYAILKKKA